MSIDISEPVVLSQENIEDVFVEMQGLFNGRACRFTRAEKDNDWNQIPSEVGPGINVTYWGSSGPNNLPRISLKTANDHIGSWIEIAPFIPTEDVNDIVSQVILFGVKSVTIRQFLNGELIHQRIYQVM